MLKVTIKNNAANNQMQKSIDYTNARLKLVIEKLSVELTEKVLRKLDNNVLNRRTSNLFRHINRKLEFTPTKLMAIVGTNIWYGALHETGATVPAHTRKAHTRKSKKGNVYNVGAHSVSSYKLPQRSFLKSSLEEMAPKAIATLEKEFNLSMTQYFVQKAGK